MQTYVQQTVLAVLRQLRGVRQFVPMSINQSQVVALVLSRLDYGNTTLAVLRVCALNRLQSVLNPAARLTLGSHHRRSCQFSTGCEQKSASSLNWWSLSTGLSTTLHLGICLICSATSLICR